MNEEIITWTATRRLEEGDDQVFIRLLAATAPDAKQVVVQAVLLLTLSVSCAGLSDAHNLTAVRSVYSSTSNTTTQSFRAFLAICVR